MSRRRKPKAKCFEPGFVYVPAVATNIAATFARIREAQQKTKSEPAQNVQPIKRRKSA